MTETTPGVVLSYGLGVDSTAVLLRWLAEPDSRDFDLADLLVITAMTGDEWSGTGADVTAHVLPRLADAGVRYAQVARGGPSQADGVRVLADTRAPDRLLLDGAWRLSDELRAAGTIAQRGGARLCSVKSKGHPLDVFVTRATAGRPYRHAIGFERDETRRIARDRLHDTHLRTGEYPLAAWGWARQDALDYIAAMTGVLWAKSACRHCPFAWSSEAGRLEQRARFEDRPDEAADAMLLEYTAHALNPAQTLSDRGPTWALAGPGAVAAFTARLEAVQHAVYEVRRVLRPHAQDPGRLANAARSVRALATGPRAAMLTRLAERAHAHGALVESDEHPDAPTARAWILRRPLVFPGTEHLLAVAPVGVADKADPRFEQWWAQARAAESAVAA